MKKQWNPTRYLALSNWALSRYVQKRENINKEQRIKNLARYRKIEELSTQKYLPLPDVGE